MDIVVRQGIISLYLRDTRCFRSRQNSPVAKKTRFDRNEYAGKAALRQLRSIRLKASSFSFFRCSDSKSYLHSEDKDKLGSRRLTKEGESRKLSWRIFQLTFYFRQ